MFRPQGLLLCSGYTAGHAVARGVLYPLEGIVAAIKSMLTGLHREPPCSGSATACLGKGIHLTAGGGDWSLQVT